MTLGSLFDGIGGFPLAGCMCGIQPLWAAEIEPFPIRVTRARFPEMAQLGSVTEIDGGKIQPVDVITFGSPCQDLSVAGLQKGIHEGTRSSLFFEAIRIIKEMRERDRAVGRPDVDLRPRFAVWENVPGAFSSNGGADFRAVLEAFAGVVEDGLSIPQPKKWGHAGCMVGNGWSVAWRVYDAQYWPGTPQRRKRIYLVADFASERAGEILFEQQSLYGDTPTGGKARKGAAADAQGSAGGGRAAGFKGNQGSRAGGIGWQDGLACTLNADCPGLEPTVCYDTTQITSPANYSNPQSGDPCHPLAAQQHPPLMVYAIQGNVVDREAWQNGSGVAENMSPTINGVDRHAVVALDGRNMTGTPELSGTLQAKANGGQSLNFINPIVYDARGNGGQVVPSLTGDHENRVTDYTALAVGNGQLHNITMANVSNTLDCMHDHQAVLTYAKPPRKHIVRRLTPLECLRLQGYPDWWFDGVEGSDSAKYKACGNSLAIPCAADVMRRIAKEGYT